MRIGIAGLDAGNPQESLAGVEGADHLVGHRVNDLLARLDQAEDIPLLQAAGGVEIDQVLVIDLHDDITVNRGEIPDQFPGKSRQDQGRDKDKYC